MVMEQPLLKTGKSERLNGFPLKVKIAIARKVSYQFLFCKRQTLAFLMNVLVPKY